MKQVSRAGGLGTKRLLSVFSVALLIVLGILQPWRADTPRPEPGSRPLQAKVELDEGLGEAELLLPEPGLGEREAESEQPARVAVDVALLSLSAADSEAPEVGKRDLMVRVFDSKGQLLNGVPVALYVQKPGGEWMQHPSELRFSGLGDNAKRPVDAGQLDSKLKGIALWQARGGYLGECWRSMDKGMGAQVPRLAVGIDASSAPQDAGLEAERVPLDLANWPDAAIELVVGDALAEHFLPLRVEVFFADGRPAPGVPVGLYGLPAMSELGHGSFFARAISGPDGVAQLPIDTVLRMGAMLSAKNGGKQGLANLFELFVTPAFPVSKLFKYRSAGGIHAGATIRMDLPPVARLRASFWNARGEPYLPVGTAIQFRGNWECADGQDRPYLESLNGKTDAASLDLGWIGMGVACNARAWPDDGDVPNAAAILALLTTESEAELRFEFGERNLRLAWLLLDAEGQPLPAEPIRYFVRAAESNPTPDREQKRNWRTSSTDDEGRFLWIMAADLKQPMLIEFEHEKDQVLQWASNTLPMQLPPRPRPSGPGSLPLVNMGEIKLNSIALESLPQPVDQRELLLVAGSVLDESGAPIPGVSIDAYGNDPSRNRFLGRTKSDSNGNFSLVLKLPEPCFLRLSHRDYARLSSDSREPYAPGTSGLQFTLVRAGKLKLSFAESALPFGDFVSIRANGDQGNYEARGKGPKEYEIEGIPAGSYRVSIHAERSRIELARFNDVIVNLEQPALDPRLVDIDFHSLVYARWYTFEAPDGQPIDNDEVQMSLDQYPSARSKQDTNGSSRLYLVLPRDVQTVRFAVPGVGSAIVPMGDEDVVVRLAGGW